MQTNSESRAKKRRVFIKTFGCQMNEYDSEKMLGLLAETHDSVASPDVADLVIVNTCSVREKGEHKLFSLLGKLRDLKAENPQMIIGVGGCVAQQEGLSIVKRNAAVDFVVGTHNLSLIPSLVRSVEDGRGTQVAVDYREEWELLPEDFRAFSEAQNETRERSAADRSLEETLPSFGHGVRALVAIQRGCNKRCAFCVVPTTRGPEVSRNPEEILREIKLKVRLGAKEILLLGQTVNSYGRDRTPRYPFEDLIRRIAEIDGVERIRFTSPHPAEVRPEFIELYGEIPQLCPHIHLPLQSGSDRILKLMNRNYRVRRYLEIIEELRARLPDIAITTDVITGFPTETPEDFEQTLEVMRKVRYNSSYSFQYSIRPNTVAAEIFRDEDEVPFDIARRRLLTVQALQDELSREQNEKRLGEVVEVLVENEARRGEGREDQPSAISLQPREHVLRGRIPEGTSIEVIVPTGQPEAREAVKTGVGSTILAKVERVTPYGLRGILQSEQLRNTVCGMNLCDKKVLDRTQGNDGARGEEQESQKFA